MADDPEPKVVAVPEPTIHEAMRLSGPTGAVGYGAQLSFDQAVKRRMAGQDLVVIGEDKKANRKLAQKIEEGIGGRWVLHLPHRRHPDGLPHYQQVAPPPHGHAFYDVDNRKARRNP